MMRKLAATALVLFAAFVATAALAEGASRVNIAGEQRMLTQRIAKAYCQIGLNVLPGIASAQMTAAVGRFDANMAALKTFAAGSPEVTRALERLAREWQDLRSATSAAVSRDSALDVSRHAESALLAAERLTRAIEDDGKSVIGQTINLAGRQRMLSQRIARIYLLRSWGFESSTLREEMDSAVNDFSAGLAKLRARVGSVPVIAAELEEVAQQWEWMQTALAAEGIGSYRLVVAESADAILETTDRITRLVEQQGLR